MKIDIEDDGTVTIVAESEENLQKSLEMIRAYTDEVEADKIYEGEVQKTMEFGAFVEVLPGKDGLVHISELAPYRVNKVEDVLKEGDIVKVKCVGIDDRGRIKLSRVEALTAEEKSKEKEKHYNNKK